MFIINPYLFVPPAPTILATSSVLTATTADPFSAAHTITANTDGIVAIGGWVRNQEKVLGTLTYGGVAMTIADFAEDNDAGLDCAGCYVAWLTTAGGLLTGAQNLVADLTVGNPDNWSWLIYDLQGLNQTAPEAASGSSDTSGSLAKSVAVNTAALGIDTLVLGGRIIGRGANTFTPGSDVTEVADDLNSNLALFVGKRESMVPTNFSFACTATNARNGDAMAAVAFKG